MSTKDMKNAAEWFYRRVFQDEAIRPKFQPPAQKTPAPIRTARSLENAMPDRWQSREATFLKQARLLARYEDDYAYTAPVVRYYPTYQSLTDQELRGYFAWRTKLRRGEVRKTSLSYVFLYIYELLNLVGVEGPEEGYRKLAQLRQDYGALDEQILPYLTKWMADMVVYYELEPSLLADTPQVVFDRAVAVLADIQNREDAAVMEAVKTLAPVWLGRSRFYAQCRADMDTVIPRILRRISAHYDARCKKTMVQQYIGSRVKFPIRLFDTAVFCGHTKGRSSTYAVDEVCTYYCQNGLWSVEKYACPLRPNQKLDNLMKAIDGAMRQSAGYGHPIKCELDTKWILKLIEEEAAGLMEERRAAEAKKLTIDYSALARIRRDAAITRDKLAVDEETLLPPDPALPPPAAPAPASVPDSPLEPAEYRLLQCLLYGGDLGWVQAEGRMLSVLCDSINEKLYDEFMDAVLTMEDSPAVLEDYTDELKEMVRP